MIGAAAGRCREPRPPSCPERHGFDPNQSSGCQVRATRKCEIRGHLMNFIGGEGPELVLCSELKETLKLAKPRAQEHLGVSRVAPVPFPARGRHYCGCSRDTLRPSPGLPQSCTLRGHAAPRGLQTHACRALRVLREQLGPPPGAPWDKGGRGQGRNEDPRFCSLSAFLARVLGSVLAVPLAVWPQAFSPPQRSTSQSGEARRSLDSERAR